jgi:hypothetical protein
MRTALRVAAFTCGLALSIGCGDNSSGDDDPTPADAADIDGAPTDDARADARVDADVTDAPPGEPDATVDAVADATVDAVVDATVDAAPDVTADAAVDAGDSPDANPNAPALELVAGANTPQRGSTTGGSPFDDACPAGQVLIGFHGSLGSINGTHGQIAAHCGVLELAAAGKGYEIRIGEGLVHPARGRHAAQPRTSLCPANQVVVGFGGRGGLLIDQLTFRCAPLTIAADGPGYTVTVGTPADLTPIGGNGGNPFVQADCTAGQIATVARLRAGDSLDAIGLGCSTLTAR